MNRKLAVAAATVTGLTIAAWVAAHWQAIGEEAHQVYLQLAQNDRMRRSARLLAQHRAEQEATTDAV